MFWHCLEIITLSYLHLSTNATPYHPVQIYTLMTDLKQMGLAMPHRNIDMALGPNRLDNNNAAA